MLMKKTESIGLAKKFIQGFPLSYNKIPKWTFWPSHLKNKSDLRSAKDASSS